MDGVTQHSSRSGNFPEHLRGHSPFWLFRLPLDKSAEYLSPETSMAPQTPLGFPPLYFFPCCLSRKSLGPSRRNRLYSAYVLQPTAPRQSSSCLTSKNCATVQLYIPTRMPKLRTSSSKFVSILLILKSDCFSKPFSSGIWTVQ